MRLLVAAAFLTFLTACGTDDASFFEPDAALGDAADVGHLDDVRVPDAAVDASARPDAAPGPDMSADASPDAGDDDWVPPCPPAQEPCPIVIDSFPYTDARTTTGAAARIDDYPSCAPQDEGGPEILYVFRVQQAGTLVAGVASAAGADIDLHLLSGVTGDTCLRRGDVGLSAHLQPGVYYLSADSFVSGGGDVGDGAYDLRADFYPDDSPCAMVSANIPRIGTDDLLAMPAAGRVVKEAHLMTEEEHQANLASGMTLFPGGWPTSFTDRIDEHYALSVNESGYVMMRSEPWAPCCEPTNEFAQGSSIRPPALAETWYINMRWRTAPARGERYIVVNPATGVAVVAAAGYENGPGDLSRVRGGASEEIHDVMGTSHLGTMVFGQAVDQAAPYGPLNCY